MQLEAPSRCGLLSMDFAKRSEMVSSSSQPPVLTRNAHAKCFDCDKIAALPRRVTLAGRSPTSLESGKAPCATSKSESEFDKARDANAQSNSSSSDIYAASFEPKPLIRARGCRAASVHSCARWVWCFFWDLFACLSVSLCLFHAGLFVCMCFAVCVSVCVFVGLFVRVFVAGQWPPPKYPAPKAHPNPTSALIALATWLIFAYINLFFFF